MVFPLPSIGGDVRCRQPSGRFATEPINGADRIRACLHLDVNAAGVDRAINAVCSVAKDLAK